MADAKTAESRPTISEATTIEDWKLKLEKAGRLRHSVILVVALGLLATAATWGQTRPVVKTGIEA
ncbi:MAG TPA: hypothetical protein VF889_07885, partial [Bacteroidota bacterium]